MANNMTGKTLNNRYLVGERIGTGGMAEVYQGQDTVLGRTVAIKIMLSQYAEDSQFVSRFKQEAASAANLQSPYIVNVYDWGQDGQTSYIVMEYVRGSDLKSAIKQRGAINQRKVAEIGSQVCQALSVAHGLDIVHRDIKPQNIMVQPDGNVKVMDFGIAWAKNSVLDKTDAVLGTAHYISPEQALGKELTAASDIYSLGVVLYEAVTGKLPFDGADAISVATMQVNETPVPPREINPAIDPNFEAIIMKAMSKDPRERFATVRDMRHCLNDLLAGRPVTIGGMSGAQTAVIGAAAGAAAVAGMTGAETAVIRPVSPDQTAVMNPTDINGSGGNVPQGQRNYIESQNKKKSSGKKKALIVFITLLVIGAVAALSFLILGKGCAVGGVTVPDVTQKTIEQARAEIKEAGFEVGKVDYQYHESIEANKVISQSPRAGTRQDKGSQITLVVSQGVEQVEVPDLSNMTANEAKAALQNAGLKYEAGPAEHSDEVAENRVLRQSPAAGKKANKGSVVTYYLSAGEEQASIPNVVGMLEGSAKTTLSNAGFKVSVDYQSSNTVDEGYVISQTPTTGTKTKSGASVSIVVSSGSKSYTASAYISGVTGGSVSPESTTVQEGGSVTFYITTQPGYVIQSVTDSNGKSYGKNSTVTISNVKSNVSLSVVFAEDGGSGTRSSTAVGY